jgi:hypothetical protein
MVNKEGKRLLALGFPDIWADLEHQNQLLKVLLFGMLAVSIVSLTIVAVQLRSGPAIVALKADGEVGVQVDGVTEEQIRAMARRYIELRYSWSPDTQAKNFALAESMVSENSISAFRKAMQDLIKFAKDRKIAQRVYPYRVTVDPKNSTIEIIADRFTEVESLRAATILKVKITYRIDSRNYKNPWGVYVVREFEEPI